MDTMKIETSTVEKLEAYALERDDRGDRIRRTASAAATGSKHPPTRHEESDSATTAYSSWMDESPSQLSSPCLAFRFSREDDDDDDDHQARHASSYSSALLPRQMSFNSSYFIAVTSHHDGTDAWEEFHSGVHPFAVASRVESRRSNCHSSMATAFTDPSTASTATASSSSSYSSSSRLAKDDSFLELAERSSQMLRRESEYEIHYHFHQGYQLPNGEGEDSPYSPIDASCRSKMMEWSFCVVGYSFPHAPSSQHQALGSTVRLPTRKHSTEAIQIVSQVFNLVDRLSSLHYRQSGGRAMDRGEYKLICMVCLHLVAKTCGLFRLYDSEREMEEYPRSCCKGRGLASSDPSLGLPGPWQEEEDSSCHYHVRDSTSNLLLSLIGSAAPSRCEEGQTIVGPVYARELSDDPPESISLRGNCDASQPRPANGIDQTERTEPAAIRPRPPLNLLSLLGLSYLCQGEFSLEELIHAEREVLQRLYWKLTSTTSVDWLHLLLDAWTLVCSETHAKDARIATHDTDEIKEISLARLETFMEANSILFPSAAAWAAVTHAQIEYDARSGRETCRVTSMYRQTVWNTLLPSYGEEELNAFRF